MTHEIDLAKRNAKALREVFAPYIVAARRTGGRARSGTGSRGRSSSGARVERVWAEPRSAEGDLWLANNSGWAVSDRGRLPGNVAEAYDAAHR